MTVLLIDLGIIGIIIFCAWRGYRNGLIRGVFGAVTLVVALILANITANAYSEEFMGILTPFAGGFVESALSELNAESFEHELEDHDNNSKEFKAAYNALRRLGLPIPAAMHVAEMAVKDMKSGSLADSIAEKLSSVMAFVAVFGVAFVLAAIVFAVIGNLIGFVFSLPGLRILDAAAGVAFGFVKGLLIVLAIAAVVRYFGLMAVDTVEKTSVLNYLVNNNIIAEMLGI